MVSVFACVFIVKPGLETRWRHISISVVCPGIIHSLELVYKEYIPLKALDPLVTTLVTLLSRRSWGTNAVHSVIMWFRHPILSKGNEA